MTVDALDHFTIVTADLGAARRFYVEMLGLSEGDAIAYEKCFSKHGR